MIEQAWTALGNLRPMLLACVEKELFTSLFRLAMEDVDMFSEMRNCMGRMPWGELHQIGNGVDSSWFKSEVGDGNRSHSFRIAASRAPPHLNMERTWIAEESHTLAKWGMLQST
jgi:hypothetical protein